MGICERKGRQRAERELRIVAAARSIAEREGWAAVTVRRLAEEIEHSQPVLYSHFENRDAIVAAVAVEGFRELTPALLRAAGERRPPGRAGAAAALEAVGFAYLAFARANPALYEAMFTLPTRLHFAVSDTEPELRATFGALGGGGATPVGRRRAPATGPRPRRSGPRSTGSPPWSARAGSGSARAPSACGSWSAACSIRDARRPGSGVGGNALALHGPCERWTAGAGPAGRR